MCPFGPLEWLYYGYCKYPTVFQGWDAVYAQGSFLAAEPYSENMSGSHDYSLCLGHISPKRSALDVGQALESLGSRVVWLSSQEEPRSPHLTWTSGIFSLWGPELTYFPEAFSEPKPIRDQVRVFSFSTLLLHRDVIFLGSPQACLAPGLAAQ